MNLASWKNRLVVQQADAVHTSCQDEFAVLRFTRQIVARTCYGEIVSASDQLIRDPAEDERKEYVAEIRKHREICFRLVRSLIPCGEIWLIARVRAITFSSAATAPLTSARRP